MVKLTTLLALSTLIIASTFASELETRDVAQSHLSGRELLGEAEATIFARDMEDGLFARQQDFEHLDLSRRFDFDFNRIASAGKAAAKMAFGGIFRRDAPQNVPVPQYTKQDLLQHRPFTKHEFVGRDLDDEVLERDLDHELYGRDLTDDDLFERFYDDLD